MVIIPPGQIIQQAIRDSWDNDAMLVVLGKERIGDFPMVSVDDCINDIPLIPIGNINTVMMDQKKWSNCR